MGAYAGPDVSENGLVLALDAGNPNNYNLTAVEVLVVAGGGGGAADVGGGGGAGGLIYNPNFAVTPGSALTVTVGGGGSGRAPFDTSAGGSGGNSVFGSLTATGGGGGGCYANQPGSTGGSGGGGAGPSGSGGAGTSGQGFAGGSGIGGVFHSGGGGGAGSVGGNGTLSPLAGGSGGVGLEFAQFASVGGSPAGWFAGGGGGGGGNDSGSDGRGFGGLGGGGTGASRSGTYGSNSSFRDGAANTGGGGGGTGGWNTGGNGGSGIVIVRYPGPQKAIGGTVTSVNGYTIHTFTDVGSTTFTPLAATNNSAILGLSDLSGNNNFGTSGASTASPIYNSSSGGALTFDSGDIVTVPMSGLRPTSAITQEVWVYITNNTSQVFIGAQYGTGSNNSYALWLNGANNWTAGVNIGGSFNYQSHNATITTSTWYHFVHTYDGSNQRLYLNGSQVRSWATTGSIVYDTNNTLLAIGNDWNGSGYNTGASIGIQGRLSNVKIYNRALTASEIQQNYNATKSRFGL